MEVTSVHNNKLLELENAKNEALLKAAMLYGSDKLRLAEESKKINLKYANDVKGVTEKTVSDLKAIPGQDLRAEKVRLQAERKAIQAESVANKRTKTEELAFNATIARKKVEIEKKTAQDILAAQKELGAGTDAFKKRKQELEIKSQEQVVALEKQANEERIRRGFAANNSLLQNEKELAELQVRIAEQRAKRISTLSSLEEKERKKEAKRIAGELKEEFAVDKAELSASERIANLELGIANVGVSEFEKFREEMELRKEYRKKELDALTDYVNQMKEIESSSGVRIDTATEEAKIVDLRIEQRERDLEHEKYIAQARYDLEEEYKDAQVELNALRREDYAGVVEKALADFDDEHARKMEKLKQQYEDELLLKDVYEKRKAQLEEEYSRNRKIVERNANAEILQIRSGFVGELSSIFGELYSATGEQMKGLFLLQKAFAVAEILMNTHVAASKALAKDVFFGMSEAQIITALGYARAGMVAGLSLAQNFADGGKVRGVSPHSRADNIRANLTANEWVHPVPTSRYYGDGIMEAIRTRRIPKEILEPWAGGRGKTSSGNFSDGGKAVTTENNVNQGITVPITINGGDEHSVRKAIPELVSAVKRVLSEDLRNNGSLRRDIMNYAR